MKGHGRSRASVFYTVRDVADKYQRYFTTLYSKVMADNSLKHGYTYKVYEGYTLKVKNFKNLMNVLDKHYQFASPSPARQSPVGIRYGWPDRWACRICGTEPHYYSC